MVSGPQDNQQYCSQVSLIALIHPHTVNFLNIRTPKKFVVITLKFEVCGSTIE